MARTPATLYTLPGSYDTDGLQVSWLSFDDAANMDFTPTEREIVMFKGTGAATVTVVSIADPFSRTGDLEKVLAIGNIWSFGPIKKTGFLQADGKIWLNSTADVDYMILKTP